LGLPSAWRRRLLDQRATERFRLLRLAAPTQSLPDGENVLPLTRRSPKMARLEAALFVAGEALSARRLAQFATLANTAEVHRLVEQLNQAYDATGSAFRVERVAGGYRLLTRPEYAPWLERLYARQAHVKLSAPAMETLTIVAYRQPVTRADIEAIRGVQCADILKQLMDRDLVRIVGEDNSLGRPFLYGTTRKFLEVFGLGSLDDLPMADRLRRPAAQAVDEPAEEKTKGPPDQTADQSDEEAARQTREEAPDKPAEEAAGGVPGEADAGPVEPAA